MKRYTAMEIDRRHSPLHVVPIGGEEPEHSHSEECWCSPLASEGGRIFIHHAKDGREKFERFGFTHWDRKWMVVKTSMDDEDWCLTGK